MKIEYSEEELNNMSEEELRQVIKNNQNIEKNQQHNKRSRKEPIGLGGWLFFFYISMFIGGYNYLRSYYDFYTTMNSPEYSNLTDSSFQNYHFLWSFYHNFNLYSCIIFMALIVTIFYLSIKFSNKLPMLVNSFLLLSVFKAGINYWVIYVINRDLNGIMGDTIDFFFRSLISSIVISIIWSAYFVKSKRVKNTFVRSKVKQGSIWVTNLAYIIGGFISYGIIFVSSLYSLYAMYVSFAGGTLWLLNIELQGGFKNGIINILILSIIWTLLNYVVRIIVSILMLIVIELFGYNPHNE